MVANEKLIRDLFLYLLLKNLGNNKLDA